MPNWRDVQTEILDQTRILQGDVGAALDTVRRKYLKNLFSYTNRNVIAYYSGFLSKPGMAGIDINDEDKNGLMVAIHQLDRSLGLDLILHTPGGSIATAETLVDYLKRMFGRNMRAIIPQIAMSAGTMIACACKEIWMGKQSNLGPVDPQRNGIPAAGVMAEFLKAYDEILVNPQTASVWQFVLRQYTPSFLGQCENAVDWAKNFVQTELENNMFYRRKNKRPLPHM
jgi:ClpP class serine protease